MEILFCSSTSSTYIIDPTIPDEDLVRQDTDTAIQPPLPCWLAVVAGELGYVPDILGFIVFYLGNSSGQ